MVCGLLREFGGGYTLSTLLAEDARLWKLAQIEAMGRPPDPAPGAGGLGF